MRNLRALSAVLVIGLCALAGTATAEDGTGPAPRQTGRPAADSPIQFDLVLPLRDTAALDQLLAEQQRSESPLYHHWLTPQQFKARFGADAATMKRVRAVLEGAGFTVDEHASSFRASGSIAATERVLGTNLGLFATAQGGTRIAAATPLHIARALAEAGARIAAFNPYRQPRHINARIVESGPDNRVSAAGPYWFDDLKQAYGYPAYNAKFDGKPLIGLGVTIGIVISSDVLDSDLDAYFNHENYAKISGRPNPKIERRVVEGGHPFNASSDDSLEASLDVQQALGSAPGAHLILYNIPNLDDDSIVAGYVDVVEDARVDVVSSSFGECEALYSPAYNGGTSFWDVLDALDELFQQGNAEGISWMASSGDSGGLDCPSVNYLTGAKGPYRFLAGVETPADSSYVTAVGGTNLVTTAPFAKSLTSVYVSENANGDPEIPYDPFGLGKNVSGGYWGAGGGVSQHFAKPAYQNLVPTGASQRALPDIGMQVGGCPADISKLPCGKPRSSVFEYLGGQVVSVIGTSVASPEFAGVAALLVQRSGGRVGNLNTYIYTQAAKKGSSGGGGFSAAQYYHRDIPGFDGLYHATPNKPYNFITGTGTPNVRFWLGLPKFPVAGNPQTPSNP